MFLFILLAVLNLLDMIFTAVGLSYGFIEESNPLMDSLWSTHPVLFIGIKLFISAFILLWIHPLRRSFKSSRMVRILTYIALAMYLFVIGLHAFWMLLLL